MTLVAGRRVATRRLFSSVAPRPAATETNVVSGVEEEQTGEVEPPPSYAYSIKTKGFDMEDSGAALRQVGTTRRFFLLDPYLTSTEIQGMAYRLRVMSKNQGISSVLIATDDDDDVEFSAIASSARDSERLYVPVVDMPQLGKDAIKDDRHIWHVAGGYNPRDLFQSGDYKDPTIVQTLMDGLSDLALATRGDNVETRVPVVTLPHGLVNDGGYALCMGSYMLASPDTCFAVLNPSRGLAFDPIGLSFILPRLGVEFSQPVANFPGAGMLLALTGMHANAQDMMETGLATNYMDSVSTLGTLERTLGNLLPWNQQGIKPKPKLSYGEPEPKHDVNGMYRNVGVAGVMNAFTSYQAAGGEMWGIKEENYMPGEDPSLELDPIPWQDHRESDLVDIAATFDDIFRQEKTLVGVLERFREVASKKTNNREEQEGIDVAKYIVSRIQSRSPLAVSAVFRLLQMGSREHETLESCMEREKRVQAKLFGAGDFEAWGNHAMKYEQSREPPFTGWKHKSIVDVTKDEVEELLST